MPLLQLWGGAHLAANGILPTISGINSGDDSLFAGENPDREIWTLHGIKATAAILVSRFSEASKSSPQRLWRLTGVIGAPPFGVHYSDDPFVNVFCEKDLERYAPPFFCTDAIYEYQLTSMDIKAGG